MHDTTNLWMSTRLPIACDFLESVCNSRLHFKKEEFKALIIYKEILSQSDFHSL